MTPLILGGVAIALGGAFGAIAWMGNLYGSAPSFVRLFVLASVAYGLAVLRVVRHPVARRGTLIGILVAAAAFRLILLPTTPTLSTDLYRYLWDGRLSVAGLSPYRYPPNAPELTPFRDGTLYPRLSHVDWRTIYPPGAQLLFTGVARLAPESALGMKLLIVACDLATIGLLLGWLRALGRPLAWVLVYAWHPLVVIELAGTGHLDGVVFPLTVAALWAATRGRERWAGALLGVGALVKLYPALLLPAVWRRRPGWVLAACGAVGGAGYLLYARDGTAVLGSLGRYFAEEEFNPGVRAALDLALAPLGPVGLAAARVLPLLALGATALGVTLWAREAPVWRRAIWLIGAYLLLVPNLFPWYTLWIVPLLAVSPAWPWLYLSCAVGLTYVIFAEPVWHIPTWVQVAQFVPFAVGLALTLWPRSAAVDYVAGSGAIEVGR